jgi:hypothetical protein
VVCCEDTEGGKEGEGDEEAGIEGGGEEDGDVDSLAEAREAASWCRFGVSGCSGKAETGETGTERKEKKRSTNRNFAINAPFGATSTPIPSLQFSLTLLSALRPTCTAPTLVTAPPKPSFQPPNTVLPQLKLTCLLNTPLVASTAHPVAWFNPTLSVESL